MVVEIICGILELAMLAYIVIRIVKSKQISLKDTVVYPVLIIVSTIIIFYGQYTCYEDQIWYKVLPNALSGAIGLLAMKWDDNLSTVLYSQNFPLFVSYVASYAISALALFSLSVSLFKVALKNLGKVKIFYKQIDYIFDLTDDSKTYLLNLKAKYKKDAAKINKWNLIEKYKVSKTDRRKNTVVVLHKNYDKNYTEEKLFLDSIGVKFVVLNYKDSEEKFNKAIDRLSFYRLFNKDFSFISFLTKEKEISDFVNRAKKYLTKNNLFDKSNQFIISTTPSQTLYVTGLVEGPEKRSEVNNNANNPKNKPLKEIKKNIDQSKGCIRCVDKYALLALDFITKNNFAKTFPKEYLNDDATIKDCHINLFMLGFGKVNQALLKDILINTQFVTKQKIDSKGKGNSQYKYELKPVRMNVTIFDENKNSSDLQISSGILNYDKSNYKDQDNYFDLPEDYKSHVSFVNSINVEGVEFFDKIKAIIQSQIDDDRTNRVPIVNYFVVSIGSDFENVSIAQRLKNLCINNDVSLAERDAKNNLGPYLTNIIYVRTEDSSIMDGHKCDGAITFGDKKTVLTFENVVAYDMYLQAKIQNCLYKRENIDAEDATKEKENIEKSAKEWMQLTKIEQDSNVYQYSNTPFKASLLKLNVDVDGKILSSNEDVIKRYDPNNSRDEQNTLMRNIRDKYYQNMNLQTTIENYDGADVVKLLKDSIYGMSEKTANKICDKSKVATEKQPEKVDIKKVYNTLLNYGNDLNIFGNTHIEKEEVERAYTRVYKCKDEDFCARDVLAFAEHERWVAYELSVGVLPLDKKGIIAYEQNKSFDESLHSCVATCPGLLDYLLYMVNEINGEKNESKYFDNNNPTNCILIESPDVINYDYQAFDRFAYGKKGN